MRAAPEPGVPLDADRMAALEARADEVITQAEADGVSSYDRVWPVVRRIRQRLGRPGIGIAVGMLIDEGIFQEGDRARVEQSMRLRWRKWEREPATDNDQEHLPR